MFLSSHVRVPEWIHTLALPECQGTPSLLEAGAKSDILVTSTGLEATTTELINKHSTI